MIALLSSISLIFAYLMGSIPFAYLYGRLFKKRDIRELGSGNIGATNVMRIFGTKAGVTVLIMDVLKGYIPVFLVLLLMDSNKYEGINALDWLPVLVGIFCILGHSFTCFLKFRGGKGVATSAGVFMALSPLSFLAAITLFLIIVVITKYVSLGSMIAAAFIVVCNFVFFDFDYYIKGFTLLIGLFLIFKHKSNIKRLLSGTENKISIKKKER